MRVLVLGFSVSDAMFERVLRTDRNMPVQTQRFGWNLIEALRSQGIVVDLLCAEPVTDFPNNSRLWIQGERFERHGQPGLSVSFVNVPGLKHLFRFLGVWWKSRWNRTRPSDLILVHGVHSAFLWAGLLVSRRQGVPIVPVITDAPSLPTRYDNRLTRILKVLDAMLIRSALMRVTGAVVLTDDLAKEFVPGKPYLLLPGIVEEQNVAAQVTQKVGPLTVVYAGSLHASYGVSTLVDAVAESTGDWRLVICGRGPLEGQLELLARESERVTFFGSVDPHEVPALYEWADILVNPRPPDTELARHSFPSKLIEYMAAGRPVVSTRLPTIDQEMAERLCLAESDAAGIARAIDEVAAAPATVRVRLGARSRDFAINAYGQGAQGERLAAYFGDLSV